MATILIVDDDNVIRDTLHELLSYSHECHTADRAEQALAYLDIETYDVVLTDISMPQLSGREILNYIQEKHPATPVIVISGMPNDVDGKALIDAGAFAYFAKPFKLDEIEEAVVRAIARHQELKSANQSADQGVDQSVNASETEPSAPDTDSSN